MMKGVIPTALQTENGSTLLSITTFLVKPFMTVFRWIVLVNSVKGNVVSISAYGVTRAELALL